MEDRTSSDGSPADVSSDKPLICHTSGGWVGGGGEFVGGSREGVCVCMWSFA